jgi:tRNA/tmRNA/rRNA uracil-C5-methylase (TrmA/RlmC/RlmD family)
VLLDPPRQGADVGVLETIAARRAQRIVHVVCNIDLLPTELRRWTASGYRVARAVPLDMFPGTSTIETVLALQPA